MRRHPSLIPLSRFHRSALFVAQMCKEDGPVFKGYPSVPEEKVTYAVDFYLHDLDKHFQVEEKVVFPILAGIDPELDERIAEALMHHNELRSMFETLKHAQPDELNSLLDKTGRLLEKHVRMEERQLFQRAQEVALEQLLKIKL